ncbi:MAG TPA: hypothetical protein VFX29_00900 [Longimicrobiaceae bacterium]|nr:hypothetical protein [Longimicrobiaceae bacterium]
MSAPRRWAELRAVLGWIAGSWARPAGSEARWEQPGSGRRGGSQPSGAQRTAPPTEQHTSPPAR